jgi:hypothetical protein
MVENLCKAIKAISTPDKCLILIMIGGEQLKIIILVNIHLRMNRDNMKMAFTNQSFMKKSMKEICIRAE